MKKSKKVSGGNKNNGHMMPNMPMVNMKAGKMPKKMGKMM